ncbi:dual specificity protein phosphatase 22-A isoform X2 [Zootoca vivipara]|uniref:dual specificity protein phosphatase 22-A isoform X2 n=1 Tax=Zootoca vivipara TaxID=8524 RepID=UPI00158FAADB|nr:dual specificity protein phosphatase 22-A isoform X2 [Zootoca vivipara]
MPLLADDALQLSPKEVPSTTPEQPELESLPESSCLVLCPPASDAAELCPGDKQGSWNEQLWVLCVSLPAEELQSGMGTGMSKVVGGLYLGNIRDSEDKENLVKNGITHILSVHNNAKPVLEDMTYLCISASDSSNQNLIQHFKECIRFIHECRLHGGGCLIHCLAGVSRSTTILVAYLMTVTNFGWEECLTATKAVRSYVSPNFGFQEQLQEYEVTLLKEGLDPAGVWQEPTQ